ncbi:hypothetical protein IIA16_04260 [bacterium]|nr:hypothetical protein [bacterium]
MFAAALISYFALTWAWPGGLAALDPAAAWRWQGMAPCRPGSAIARPLLLRPGPDGDGIYLSSVAVAKGREVVAVSVATGMVIAQGRSLGGRIIRLRGLGHKGSTLPVEAAEGVSAMLTGNGRTATMEHRPANLPVRGWTTAGSAGGIPTGVPVAGPDPGTGPLPLESLAGPVRLLWTAE